MFAGLGTEGWDVLCGLELTGFRMWAWRPYRLLWFLNLGQRTSKPPPPHPTHRSDSTFKCLRPSMFPVHRLDEGSSAFKRGVKILLCVTRLWYSRVELEPLGDQRPRQNPETNPCTVTFDYNRDARIGNSSENHIF